MRYSIKYKNSSGSYGIKIIEASSKLEAMQKFNNKYKYYNVEIKEVIEEQVEEKCKGDSMEQKETKTTHITMKDYVQLQENKNGRLNNLSDMLEKTNEILFEQLNKIKDIDTEDKEKAELEISKNNSVAGTGKTLIQSIGMQMMIEKQKGIL